MDLGRLHAAARRQKPKGSFNAGAFLRVARIRGARPSGRSLMIRCPWADDPARHRNGDRNPSFSLSLKGSFICFGCHITGGYELLFEKFGLTEEQIDQCFYEPSEKRDRTIEVTRCRRIEVPLPDEYEACVRQTGMFSDTNVVHYPDYLRGRGVSAYQLWAYRVGVCFDGDYSGRVIFPVVANARTRGFVARDVTGAARKKIMYPPGMEASSTLYNFDRAYQSLNGKPVVVVEGVMDVLRVEAAGYPAVGLLGSRISKDQAVLLSVFPKLLLMPDRD